jgi:hypothetical protein
LGKKDDKLCDWKKDDIKKNFEALRKIVSRPKYVCKKCARVSAKSDHICKPVSLKAE